MVIYIPNQLYYDCNFGETNLEDFVKRVFCEYCVVDGVDKEEVKRAIKQISIIEANFGT